MNDTDVVNILMVDDRPENLFALEALLEGPEVNLITATSGNEALRLVLKHDFALVLLDVQMPEMDGFEVAKLMRSSKKTAHIPIIFVTAISKEKKNVLKGYGNGAVDYLFKPIDDVVLRSKVDVFCNLKRAELRQQRLLDELTVANAQLRELDGLKSEFLSTASHELRTPLTIIREFVSLVRDEIAGPINEQQRDCMDSALGNCDRLSSLINDLLDLERIESGEHRVCRRQADLKAVLERCHHDFLPRCRAEGQELRLEVPAELPAAIFDRDAMVQVLVNLIGNAHKFTPSGGTITLRAAAGGDTIVCEVADTGKGIPAKDQEKIFDKFTQIDRQDGPGAKGTGLGLSIVKKIVDLHDGTIAVTSATDEGTTFSVTLPVYDADRQLQAFLDDSVNRSEGTIADWTLLLFQPCATTAAADEQTAMAALDRLEMAVRSVLRREDDDTLIIGERKVLAVLAQTDADKSRVLLQRMYDEYHVGDGARCAFEVALATTYKDCSQKFSVVPAEMEFEPLAPTAPAQPLAVTEE